MTGKEGSSEMRGLDLGVHLFTEGGGKWKRTNEPMERSGVYVEPL